MSLEQPDKRTEHHKETDKANEIYAQPSKSKHGQGFVGVMNHLAAFRNNVNLAILVQCAPSLRPHNGI